MELQTSLAYAGLTVLKAKLHNPFVYGLIFAAVKKKAMKEKDSFLVYFEYVYVSQNSPVNILLL